LKGPAEEIGLVWAGSGAPCPLTLVSAEDKLEDEHASCDIALWQFASFPSTRLAFSRSFSWGAGALLGFPLPTRTCRSTSAAIMQHAVVHKMPHASGPFRAALDGRASCKMSHTQALRDCLAVPACARGGVEAYFALASLPSHPPSGLWTQFCLCTSFPACWAAGGSGGEARTPTHAQRMHARAAKARHQGGPT
jgi:hypothetical protein